MFSAKQGHYWYHFYNVFGMTRTPALEASTIFLSITLYVYRCLQAYLRGRTTFRVWLPSVLDIITLIYWHTYRGRTTFRVWLPSVLNIITLIYWDTHRGRTTFRVWLPSVLDIITLIYWDTHRGRTTFRTSLCKFQWLVLVHENTNHWMSAKRLYLLLEIVSSRTVTLSLLWKFLEERDIMWAEQ